MAYGDFALNGEIQIPDWVRYGDENYLTKVNSILGHVTEDAVFRF
jgi:hypothetical protein